MLFCGENLQLCHLSVDSKAYDLPSYISIWLLESQGSPNHEAAMEIPKIQLFGYSNSLKGQLQLEMIHLFYIGLFMGLGLRLLE